MKATARILAIVVGLVAVGVQAQEILPPGKDVLAPQVVREVKPDYTPEAKAQRIQGNVELSVVVKDDGSVGEVTVTRSLDDTFGLDPEAVNAMRQWQFKPGTKNGKPVAVRVSVEMTFRLK